MIPRSISPDGRRLAYTNLGSSVTRAIWILPLDTADPDHPKAGAPEMSLGGASFTLDPAFSPDGHWLAYTAGSNDSPHVYVRPYPATANGSGQVQVSTGNGRYPIWSHNGKELFYIAPMDGRIMVVSYTANGESFTAGKARPWAENAIAQAQLSSGQLGQHVDLAPDGNRFIILAPPQKMDEKADLHLTFLLNFFDELKRKLPAAGR